MILSKMLANVGRGVCEMEACVSSLTVTMVTKTRNKDSKFPALTNLPKKLWSQT